MKECARLHEDQASTQPHSSPLHVDSRALQKQVEVLEGQCASLQQRLNTELLQNNTLSCQLALASACTTTQSEQQSHTTDFPVTPNTVTPPPAYLPWSANHQSELSELNHSGAYYTSTHDEHSQPQLYESGHAYSSGNILDYRPAHEQRQSMDVEAHAADMRLTMPNLPCASPETHCDASTNTCATLCSETIQTRDERCTLDTSTADCEQEAELESRLQSSASSNAALRAELLDSRELLESLKQTAETLKQECLQLTSTLENERTSNATALHTLRRANEVTCDANEAKIATLDRQLADVICESEAAAQTISQLQVERDSLSAALSDAYDVFANATEQAERTRESLEKELAAMQVQLQSAQRAAVEAAANSCVSKQERDVLVHDLHAVHTECEILGAELAAAREEASSAHVAARSAKNAHETSRAELSQLLHLLEEARNGAEAERDASARDLHAVHADLIDAEAEAEVLAAQLHSARKNALPLMTGAAEGGSEMTHSHDAIALAALQKHVVLLEGELVAQKQQLKALEDARSREIAVVTGLQSALEAAEARVSELAWERDRARERASSYREQLEQLVARSEALVAGVSGSQTDSRGSGGQSPVLEVRRQDGSGPATGNKLVTRRSASQPRGVTSSSVCRTLYMPCFCS